MVSEQCALCERDDVPVMPHEIRVDGGGKHTVLLCYGCFRKVLDPITVFLYAPEKGASYTQNRTSGEKE